MATRHRTISIMRKQKSQQSISWSQYIFNNASPSNSTASNSSPTGHGNGNSRKKSLSPTTAAAAAMIEKKDSFLSGIEHVEEIVITKKKRKLQPDEVPLPLEDIIANKRNRALFKSYLETCRCSGRYCTQLISSLLLFASEKA